MTAWPFGSGEMAERIRNHPWTATSLGSSVHWSESLRTAVSLMLAYLQPAFVVTSAARILLYNDSYARLLGAKHPNALGDDFLDVWPEVRDTVAPLVSQACHGESIQADMQAVVLRDGVSEEIRFGSTYLPIRDASGTVVGLLGYYTDVIGGVATEAQIKAHLGPLPITQSSGSIQRWMGMSSEAAPPAQERLRESEERLAAIFLHAPVGLSEIGLDGRFLRANDELCRILGRSTDELLQLGIDDVTHPEDLRPSLEALNRTLRTGQPGSLDKRYRRPDGTIVFANSTLTRLHDASGRPGNLLVVTVDLTHRKAAEAALAESESRLRTLMQGIPQLVWRSGDGGQWTWCSPQWQTFTGQDFEQSRDLGWLDAVHPDDREATMKAWQQAPETGGLNIEYRVRRAADGAYLWHHTRSSPVRDEAGRVLEWLGTTTEVQQLKELQERQAVMVAELQHRTRNLIAVVRSIAAQTMLQTGPGEAFREEFSHRLEALARVQGLLSRSREEPVTIGGLIEMELDALGALEQSTGQLIVNGPPVRLRSSIVQTLALALHELATNARKHGALSPNGGGLRVTWQLRDGVGETHWLALEWVETRTTQPDEGHPERRGYGRELIERALPYSLGAKTTYELRPEGVRCTIDIPLEKRAS